MNYNEIALRIAKSFKADQSPYGMHAVKIDDSELHDALGTVIPWFIDSNQKLKNFWDKHHSDWSNEVSIYRTGSVINLTSSDGEDSIQIVMKGI